MKKAFRLEISLSNEEIDGLKCFKLGNPKNWDSLEEQFGCDYEIPKRLLDLKLINWVGRNIEDVALSDYGKQILEQL